MFSVMMRISSMLLRCDISFHTDGGPSRIIDSTGKATELTQGHRVIDEYDVIMIRSALGRALSGHALRAQLKSVTELHASLSVVKITIAAQRRLLAVMVEAEDCARRAKKNYEELRKTNGMTHPKRVKRR
jgi:hypothetical protein